MICRYGQWTVVLKKNHQRIICHPVFGDKNTKESATKAAVLFSDIQAKKS